MTHALLKKELRECWPLVALSLMAAIYALWQHLGWSLLGRPADLNDYGSRGQVPFVDDTFTATVVLIGGGLAVALGLKQSAWEEARGTYRFLLHRPASRRRVFGLKLVVGVALVLTITAALIIAYMAWAATPGNHGSPFHLSMTASTWRAWLVLPVVYLAAFLSGLRPARWYGTRLAPLVAGGVLAVLLTTPPWWEVTLLGTPLVAGLLIACIATMAAVRDY